jgi:phosphoglycerate dehydrogenase-like enzyme
VSKDALFREVDTVSVHYILGDSSRDLIGASELGLMKPTAHFFNTSRGPIVNEQSLIEALENNHIAGAGLDVFDQEPLPSDPPFRTLNNVVATAFGICHRTEQASLLCWYCFDGRCLFARREK